MTDYRHRFRHRHLLTIAHLLVMFGVLAKPLVAIELSNFKIADEDVNLGDELLNESWLLWNETEQSTENYCFLTTHLDRSSPCLLTDTMQHQSNSNRDGQAGMDPSLRDDADSQQVFLIKSATSAIRSCYKQSSTKKTCSDCSVVHKKIDVVNHIYNGSADNIVASVNVDTSLLTLQQWYQWCASELTAPAGDDPRLFYLDFFNTSGFLRLCGYRNLSCTTADGCFVGVEVTQLIVNNSKTNNCILPLEQESKSHRAESIALAVSFGTVFILVLVGASIVVFVKQQRKRGRLRETPPMSAFPAANYHELSLFQDSDSTSSSDSEELGLN